jgi:ribosomal protein L24E
LRGCAEQPVELGQGIVQVRDDQTTHRAMIPKALKMAALRSGAGKS